MKNRFFEDRASVARLAVGLGLQPALAVIETIFARYSTEVVRSFGDRLNELPPERLTTVTSFMMDRVTQILGPHIGDASSGKWRSLPVETQTQLTRAFTPFLDQFGASIEGIEISRHALSDHRM